jgi:hypothetical protein
MNTISTSLTHISSLQFWAWSNEARGLADGLLSLLLNSLQQLLARWDVVDETNDLTGSPNLRDRLA